MADETAKSKLPAILDGTFFAVESRDADTDKVVAKCLKCINGKRVSGSIASTSNFLTHIKRVHPSCLTQFEEHKRTVQEEKQQVKRKHDNDMSGVERSLKQPKLENFKPKMVTQNTVNHLIVNYIVKGMHSLRTVETDEFRELIRGLAPEATIMSRRTLVQKVSDRREDMNVDLKKRLSDMRYVCTTADAWSSSGYGYLGVTAHWITPETLARQSVALACRRLKGSHTYDVLAEALTDVYQEFGLTCKNVVGCVTDNGSNFTKAFREFGVEYGVEEDLDDGPVDVAEHLDYSCDDLHTVLNADSELMTTAVIVLPPHHPCSSHTLSLLAVTDVQEALKESASLKRLYNATMGKCSALWNSASRSLKSTEAIEAIVHRRLVKPCPTRWNSLYDSLLVLKKLREHLKTVCEAVGVAVFRDIELEFIDEYVEVLYPVATALDRLQGQTGDSMSFIGALIPTLLTVKRKLLSLSQSPNIHHCGPVAAALLRGLNRRFGHLMNMEPSATDYVIAAICHPYFKLRWVPQEHADFCRQLFSKARMANRVPDRCPLTASVASSAVGKADDFFEFSSAAASDAPNDDNKLQVNHHIFQLYKCVTFLVDLVLIYFMNSAFSLLYSSASSVSLWHVFNR